MRRVDEIKALKYELGRYQKKVGDQTAELVRLRGQLDEYEGAARQVNDLVDAIMAAVAEQYGEQVREGDGDDIIGYRLELTEFDPVKIRAAWQVHAQRSGEGYTIGTLRREE